MGCGRRSDRRRVWIILSAASECHCDLPWSQSSVARGSHRFDDCDRHLRGRLGLLSADTGRDVFCAGPPGSRARHVNASPVAIGRFVYRPGHEEPAPHHDRMGFGAGSPSRVSDHFLPQGHNRTSPAAISRTHWNACPGRHCADGLQPRLPIWLSERRHLLGLAVGAHHRGVFHGDLPDHALSQEQIVPCFRGDSGACTEANACGALWLICFLALPGRKWRLAARRTRLPFHPSRRRAPHKASLGW